MKTIKFLGIFMLFAMLSMGYQSCSKDEYQSRLKELIVKDLTFSSVKDSITREYRGEDLSCYAASSDADWCTVKINVAKSTITVIVDKNKTYDARTATVILRDVVDNVSARSFKVTQAQLDCIRLKDTKQASQEIGTDGGQIVLVVEKNVNCDVYLEDGVDWITVPGASTRGLTESEIILNVAKNTSGKERETTVRIKGSGLEAQVVVTQLFTAYLNISDTSVDLDENATTLLIKISTNLGINAFDTNIADDWVTSGGREQLEEGVYQQKLVVKAITSKTENRSTTVSFVVKEADYGVETKILEINQVRSLFIKNESLEVMTGSSKKLELYNSKDADVKWTSSNEKVAKVSSDGTVTGVTVGASTITVTTADGLHTDQILVSVIAPPNLNDSIKAGYQVRSKSVDSNPTGYKSIKVLSQIQCSVQNNSVTPLTFKKVTLYCDGKEMEAVQMSQLIQKGEKTDPVTFDIPVEYADSIVIKKIEEDTSTTSQTRGEESSETTDTTDTDTTETDTSDSESTDSESTDTEEEPVEPVEPVVKYDTITVKIPVVNTHKYTAVWNYTYSEANFEYTHAIDTTIAAATRKYARSASRKTRSRSRRR